MSDQEFEKQVQQKMEELKLRPSDTVWMEVEKNIRQQKRRRRFFWLWTPLLFICLSTSGLILYRYIYSSNQTHKVAQKVPASTTHTLTPEAVNTYHSNNVTKSTTAGTDVSNTQPAEPQSTPAAIQPNTNNSDKPVARITSHNNTPSSVTTTTNNTERINRQKDEAPVNNIAVHQHTTQQRIRHTKNRRKAIENIPAENNEAVYEKANNIRDQKPGQIIAPQDNAETPQNDLAATIPATVKEGDGNIATDKTIADSLNKKIFILTVPNTFTNNNTAPVLPIQRKRSSPWHWGIETNAGLSRIAQYKLFQLKGLLGQEQYKAEDVSGTRGQTNVSPPGSYYNVLGNNAVAVQNAAPIQPDFSFSASLFAEWSASKRFRLSVGLQYVYLSMHTDVGPKVKSPTLVNQSTSSAKIVSEYYKVAGTYDSVSPIGFNASGYRNEPVTRLYRYRFQFIELPVMMHWQINKGLKLPPIMLNGGLSLSQMISVDALHYEGTKGIYYKDDDLFNKTQFNFITGISVGLLQHTKHPVWIGPDLRYALSPLVKKEVSKGQYLWSTGITVKVLLGRL